MTSHTDGFNGSTFESLESRVLMTGAFPSAATNAIVYDAQGNLDVAYYDSAAHNLKFVQQSPSGTWTQPVVVDSSSSDVGKYLSIAVNAQGFPAIAYQDSANSDLKYAQSNDASGSTWTTAVVDKRKTTGFNPSLVFNDAGTAFISYYKQNTGDLDLATLKAGTKKWALTTVQSSGNVGQNSSIAINPATGTVAVGYSNAAGKVQYIAQNKNGKGFAAPVTVATVAKSTSAPVSLAFGSSGPVLGYVNPGTGQVDLGTVSGKKATVTPVGNVSTTGTSGAQVLIDPTTGQPSVVYHDSTGVYVAAPTAGSSTFTTTQVAAGGSNTIAAVQPGSGSIVFSTVDTSGGTLSVTTNVAPPAAPSNVAASAASTTTANVTWTDNSDDEAGFLIERSTDNVTFTTAGTTDPNATSFTDTGLTEGTLYYYRVSAIGAAGNNSAGTTGSSGGQIVPAAGIATTTTLPAAPTLVAATAASSSGITVAWTNGSHLLTGFLINRSSDGGATWTQVGSVGANVATFSDTGLNEATTYSYQIVAYNVSGGTASASASSYTLPAAPTSVSAAATSDTAITVTWNNASAAAASFLVQRSTDGTNFTTVATVNGSTTSYADTGLTEATAYYYQIEAVGPAGLDSTPSVATNAVTSPDAPTGLTTTAESSSRIDLSWTNHSSGATGYTLQRSSGGGSYVTIANLLGAGTTTFADTSLSEGVTYTYQVQATETGGASAFSAQVSSTTLPSAPTLLTATASGLTVNLSWRDNSNSETGFQVQRSSNSGSTWTTLTTTGANATSTATYVDSTVGQGSTYMYRVKAVNAAGSSAYSNTPSVTIIPAAPSGLTASAVSATQVNLSWTDNSLGETAIYVERSTDNVNWSPVATTAAFATSATDTSLTAGTTYHYRISATNTSGASSYSTASTITAPAAPSSFVASAASTSQISLSWAPVSSATTYIVSRTINNVTTQLNPISQTSLTDTGLSEGKQYTYTVSAVNASGSSVAAGPVLATTLPIAPSGVVASDITATSMLVTWSNNSLGYSALLVQRSADGGNSWTTVANPTVGTTSITDSGVLEAHSYIYQVQASNVGGSSAFSQSTATTTVPAAPTSLAATAISASDVVLNWTNNSQGATSYIVQRGTDGENFPTTVATLGGSTTTVTDTAASSATNYYYRVYAIGNGGPSDYSNDAQATTVPDAPTNVVATDSSATVIGITWNTVSGATGYNILRSRNGGAYQMLDTASTNSYTDTNGFEATRFSYIIEATSGTGTSADSAPSATVTTVPVAPDSVTVTGETAGTVSISWQNISSGATGFAIDRSSDNGNSFSPVGTALSSASTFTDTTVSEGSHYIYRVRTTGTGGSSAPSSTVGADTNPAAPTALTLTSTATDPTTINVSWTNVSTHATGYVVSRSSNGSAFDVVDTADGTATSFTDSVTADGSYQYQVRAVQLLPDNVTTLSSPWTGPLTIQNAPLAATNVQATVIDGVQIGVIWNSSIGSANSFKVYRSGGSPWTFLANVTAGTGNSYTDTGAALGGQYSYAVIAVGNNGYSAAAYSSVVTAYPPMPTAVSATTTNNPNVTFTWDDVPSETGFNLQRNDGNGWTDLATVGQGVTTYTDTTSVENVAYQYRVEATNASGNSAYSNAVSASTFLNTPTNVTIAGATSSEVDITWTDHSSSATGYEVQRSGNGGAWQSLTNSLDAGATSFADTTVSDGVSYQYQVRGLSEAGNSDFAESSATTTPLLAPTGLTTTTVSTTEVDLSWTNPSATATSFQIWRSLGSGQAVQIDTTTGTTYADTTGLANTGYTYTIIAANGVTTSAASSAQGGFTQPDPASNVIAAAQSPTSVLVTWTPSDDAEGYNVYRMDADHSWFIAGAPITSGSGDSFLDTAAVEGTAYSYKVVALGDGAYGADSNVATVTTYAAAPTSLTVSAVSATSVSLEWTDNSTNADGYVVAISTNGGQTFTVVAASTSLGSSDNEYTVTGLSEATNYQFQVFANDDAGYSAPSNTLSAMTAPAAPTGLSATISPDGPALQWTNHSANASGITVLRSSDGGATYDTSFTVAANQAYYTDTSAASNTTYTYEVTAGDAGGNSLPSNSVNALTLAANPTNFSAVSNGSTSATLTWTDSVNGTGSYAIYRDASPTPLATLPDGTTTYTDSAAASGATYTYYINPVNSSGTPPMSPNTSVTIRTTAPTSLSATAVSATSVSLQWNDVNGETGFVLQRSLDGVDGWSTVATLSSGQTSYTDTTATEATTFYYQIAGTDASGTGDFSAAASALTFPAAPTALTTTAVSTTVVNLNWTDHSQAETGYDVFRSANGGASVRIAHGLAADSTSYQDTTATAGYGYVYNVYAYNSAGSSTAATQTALTIPGQPQSLQASVPSASEIDLTWNAVFGATQYTIQRSPNGTSQWTQVGQVDSSTLSLNDTALSEGTTYYYTVTASNATGSGAAASVNAATLPSGVISLTATGTSATTVHLAWQDNSVGATGYHVYRQDNGTGAFNLVDTINDPATVAFDDTVSEGTLYTYQVAPFDASGDGIVSQAAVTTVPATPTLVSATPSSNTTVTLVWTGNSSNDIAFTVERAPFGSSTWTTLTSSLAANATTYSDTTATGGAEFQYKVIGQGNGGNSADSNIINATTYTDAVSTLSLNSVSTSEIDLSWTAVNGATGYKILRSATDSNFTQIDSVDAGVTSYQNTALPEATYYYYEVVASDATGDSAAGNTPTTSTLALAPSGLSVSAASDNQINLTWTNNSANQQSVIVEISTNGTTWSQAADTANPADASYNSTALSAGTTYYFRVASVVAGGVSYMSDATSASAITLSDAPTLTTTANIDGTITLNWGTSTGATSYTVQRSTGGGSWSTVIADTTGSTFNDTGLTGNTSYQYQILASNGSGDGADGAAVSALTVPDAPSSLVATASSTSTIGLTWTGDSGANVTFKIYRAPVSDGVTGSYVNVGSVTGSTSYSDTGLTAGNSYAYEVVASNASGQAVTPALSSQVATFPAAVTAVTSTAISGTQVNLIWTDSAGATSYTVSREAAGAGSFTLLTSPALGASATSYSDTTALAGTSYTYQIAAVNASGNSTATTSALTYPASPGGLTVTVQDNHDISVSWNAVTGAASYTLQRQVNGGAWANVTGVSGTSIVDTVAGGNTYAYQVKASDATGDSAYATTSSVTTVPDAAANFTATVTSDTSVHLAWSLSNGATGYTVERSDNNGVSYDFSSTLLSASTTSYDDTGLAELTSYKYKVVASNGGGNAADSTIVPVVTLPTGPSGLATTSVTATEVDLTWTDNTAGAAGFDVQRNDGGWHTIGTTLATVTTYQDTTVSAGTGYQYRVLSDTGSAQSAPSTALPVLTLAAAPTNIVATPISTTEVDLAWDAMTGANTYDITYSVNGGSYTSLETGVATNSYAFTTASAGTSYQFQIVANNGTGASASGSSNSTTTIPVAPGSFTATGVSASEIDLAWADVTGATKYEVDQQGAGSTWTPLTSTLPNNATSYAVTGLNAGTSYTFRVVAIDATGPSAPTASQTGLTIAAAPTNIVATPISTTEVDLAWDAMTGADTYDITYSVNGGSYTSLETGVATNSYAFTTASAGTSYQFQIVANNATGASAVGTSNSTTTIPAAPTSFTATGVSASEVDLAWDDSTGATAYEVDVQAANSSWTTLTSSLADNATSYAATSLDAGTSYTFRIEAIDGTGSSASTSSQSGLTTPAPVDAVTTTAVSSSEIDLAWTDNSGTVTAYRVMESTGGSFSQVGSDLPANAASYAVTGLSAATNYQFQVLAVNDSGASSMVTGFTGSYYAGTNTRPDLIDGAPTFTQNDPTINIGTDSYEGTGAMASVPGAPGGFGVSDFVIQWNGIVRPQYSEQYTFYMTSDDGSRLLINGQLVGNDTFAITQGEVTQTIVVPYNFVAGNTYNVEMQMRQGGGGWDARLEWSSASQSREFVSPNTTLDATTLADAPTSFTATGVSSSEIDLAWDDSTGATGYEVDRFDSGNWDTIAADLPANATGFQDTGLDAGTQYSYRVEALDAGGKSAATPSEFGLTIPAAPTNIVATPVSTTEVDLAWDTMTGADTYDITYAINGGSYNPLTIGVATNSYAFTTASAGTSYQFQIVANNDTGASAVGTSNSATTIPAAPGSFTATGVSASEIDLAWADSTGATKYEVDQQGASNTWTPLTSTLPDNATSYAVTGLDAGTSYTFRVEAVDATGPSASTTPESGLTIPAAPTNIVATPISTTEVDLAWDTMTGADTYDITYAINGGSYASLETGVATNSYAFTIASAGTSYQFQIAANNATGASDVGTSNSTTTIPATPGSFTATGVSASEIDLAWADSTGATKYEVDQQGDGNTWTPLTSTLPNNATSYAVTGLDAGTSYTFRVEAIDATGPSASTSSESGLTLPAAPTNIVATPISTTEVDLAWDTMTGADTYDIFYAINGGSYTSLETGVATNSYAFTTASAGTSYQFQIVANNDTGASDVGTSNSTTTIPAAPGSFTATGVSTSEIDLAWADSTGATKYEVDQQGAGNTWTPLTSTLPNNATSYAVTGLDAGTSYTFRVEAIDVTGPSDSAASQTALTIAAAPTNIVATPVSTTEVDLAWDAMTGADTYDITYAVNGGSYASLETGVATNSYAFTTASAGTGYQFQIVANNATGASDVGTSNSTTTIPATPGSFTATGVSTSEIDLAWADSAGATKYEVDQQGAGNTWTPLTSTLPDNATSYAVTGLDAGTSYAFRVEAIDATGPSASTASQTGLTISAAPTNIVATPISTTEVDLAWDTMTGADTYDITYAVNGGSYASLATGVGTNSYAFTTASAGTGYQFQIVANNATGASDVGTSNATATVPDAPTSFTATGVSASEVDLAWTDSTGTTAYEVDVKGSGNTWTPVTTALPDNATSYAATGLNAGTNYTFRVEALDAGGPSASTASESGLTIPAAPTNIVATPASTTEVDLAWDAMSGADTYDITYATNGGSYTSLKTGVATNSYAFTAASAGTSYQFKIVANNDTGTSAIGTSNSTTTIPAAPGSFTATGVSDSEIDLAWGDVTGATKYEVDQQGAGSTWTPLTSTLPNNATSFAVTGLDAGTSYTFRVEAIDATGPSASTTSQTGLTLAAAPTNIVATPISTTEVDLAWDAMTGADTYDITYAVNGGSYTSLETGVATNSYAFTTASAGTSYQFQIVANNDSGASDVGTSNSTTTIPAAPGSFTATGVSTSEIDLAWTDSTGATAYEVDQQGDGNTWTPLTSTLPDNAASYAVTGLDAGTSYTFRVEAIDATGPSASTASQTGLTIPAAPTNIVATPVSTTEVDLAWDAMTGADTYDITYAVNGGSYTSLETGVATNSYAFTTASAGTSYQFQIVANNDSGTSDIGTSNSAVTVPVVPAAFAATAVSAGEVDLTWTASTGATSYTIERAVGAGAFQTLNTGVLGTGADSYADTSVVGGTTYHYRIHGTDATGNSATSSAQTVLTVPAAPTNVVAIPISTTEVDLAWDNMTGADTYDITYAINGGSYNPLTTGVATNSYAFTAASAGTSYQFQIVANDDTGSSAVGTSNATATIPDVPTSFTATGVSTSEVDLAWGDVTGATKYEVDQQDAGNTWTPLTSTLPNNATSYAVTGLDAGTSYTFRVEAIDATGPSASTTPESGLTVPAAPTNIVATPVSTTEVDLAWDTMTGADTYDITYAVNGGSYTSLETGVATNSYAFTTASAGTSYQFQIAANNATGASDVGTSNATTTIPATPGSFTATGVSTSEIDLAWTDSTGATKYEVDQQGDGNTWTPLTSTLPNNATSYAVTGLDAGTSYTFRVEAIDATGPSASTASESGLTISAAPTNIVATPISTTEVDLAWDAMTGADTYDITYAVNGGSYTSLETGVATNSYAFTTASAGTGYQFQIVANNATGASAVGTSNATATVPDAPTSFTATGVSASEVDLAWDDVTGATAYEVDQQGDGNTWTPLTTTLPDDAISYAVTGLDAGTTYTFRVEAIDATGPSASTASQSGLTIPAAPTNIVATPISTTEVDLAWDNMTGADTYDITYATNGGSYSSLATAVGTNTYAFTTASAGTNYQFKIVANNDTGTSAIGTSNATETIPVVPASFAATAVSAGEVDLSWTASTGATSYIIERAVGAGSFQTLNTGVLGTGADSYIDNTVVGGTSYSYRIHGTDATGASATSSVQSVLTVPSVVVINSATAVSDSEITLAWTAASGTVTGYQVYRADADSGIFVKQGTDISPQTTSFDDTTVVPGTDYVYRVLAFNGTGSSGDSDTNTLTTVPATPADFGVTSVSNTEIDLTWTDSSGATAYQVERADGSGWDTLSSSLGNSADSYADTGLTSATQYTYRVEAIDAGGLSDPTTATAATTRPDVAGDFTATAISGGVISLAWDAVTGASSYTIMQSTNGGSYSALTTTGNTSYPVGGLAENTLYGFEIIATGDGGDGAATAPQSATTYLNTPALALTTATTTSVTLTWTNHSLLTTGYLLEQETSPGVWTDVHDGAALTNDGDTDSATITGLTEATGYNFRITALGTSGAVSVSTPISLDTVPNAPTAISTSAVSTDQINLTWVNNSADADSIVVERSSDGGNSYSPVATLAGNATSYDDTTFLSEGSTYQYFIDATKGASVSSTDVSSAVTTLPDAASSVIPVAASATEIDLAWTDNSAHADGYDVLRSASAGSGFVQVGSELPADAISYQDATAPENATSYYIVVTVGDNGASNNSDTVSATTPLAAPTTVVASTTTDISAGDKSIDLSWDNNSTVATSINIERSSNGVDYSPLTTVAFNVQSYVDTTALENTTYTYRVYAVDGGVSSTHAASNPITSLLSSPTALTLNSPTPTTVTLTWNDVSASATSYHVERSTNNVNFSDVGAVLSGTADTYNDTGLTEGTQYYYRLIAESDTNASNYTASQSITTIPAAPTTLTASPFSSTEIDLTWTDVSTTNTGYTVEQSTDGGTTWSPIATGLAGTATTYQNTALTEASDYKYEVFATGVGGNSADSNVASATSDPAAASGLTLSASSASAVSLTWTDNSTGATSYEVQRSSDGGNSWTSLTSTLGATATSFTDTTVTEGTAYQYQVRAARNGSESAFTSPLNVTTQPAAPSALAVGSVSATRVTITWTDNSNGETGFVVERSTNGGSYSVIGTPGVNSTTYSDNTVAEGLTYTYYIYATNAGGNSTSTSTVSANIPPASPTGLTSSNVTSTSVTLSWTNHSTQQTGFYVQRKTGSGSYVQIADVTSGTTYTDTTATEDGTYSYKVQAYGTSGLSGFTTSINATTPLYAPSGLTATAASATEIDLTWTNNSHAQTGFAVQRSSDGGNTWTTVAGALGAGVTSYADTGATEGTTYLYQVQATRSGANSAYSPSASGTTFPAAPSNVVATAASDTQVTVTWTNNSVAATGFTIQRFVSGTWTTAATVAGSATSYTDSGLTELTAYSYRVEATDTGGASAWANSGSSATTLPAAPSVLTVTATAADQITLNWHDNSLGATGYKVERSSDGVNFTQIALLGSTANTYLDEPVGEATTYTYRVRAVASGINSAYSSTASLTTVPAAPDSLTATTISASEIDLAWHNNSSGATAYLIEQSTDGGNTFTQIASVSGSTSSYQNTGLPEDTDYQYQVRAQDAGGYSDYTNSAEAITLLVTPTNLSGVAHPGHIDLTWTNASVQDTGYTVMRSSDGGNTWTDIADLNANTTSFSDTGATGGLTSGHGYQYRVFCSDGNSGAVSANSNTFTVTAS